MRYLMLLVMFLPVLCRSEDWQPVLGPTATGFYTKNEPSFSSLVANRYQADEQSLGGGAGGGQCDLYKVGFTQDLYFQYIQYKVDMPALKEFTLCFWSKFTNHSNDHPIFSYAVENQPRTIYSWISNTERSSYFSMSVQGHTFYRLNYPLRLNRWYHTCQSWNSRTGEWQIWVNAERVGRGFNNRLVGNTIPAGGIAITGQEQSQVGGGFQEGYAAPKGSGGMLGEITMVQLYKVALTAGKAHRDHKHHHAHKYDHNGAPITTTPPPIPQPRPSQPTHPLLTAGQLNPEVALNIAAQQPLLQFVPPSLINAPPQPQQPPVRSGPLQQTPQLFEQQQQQQQQQLQQQQQQQQLQFPVQLQLEQPQQTYQLLPANSVSDIGSYSQQRVVLGGKPLVNSGLIHNSAVLNPSSVDAGSLETHQLYKRAASGSGKILKQRKRELFLSGGQLVHDSLLSNSYDQSLLDGLAGIGENEPILLKQKQSSEEREPAEAEVKAVMSICTGCDQEPFGKAVVFAWRSVAKKLYSGAFYQPAVPECRVF